MNETIGPGLIRASLVNGIRDVAAVKVKEFLQGVLAALKSSDTMQVSGCRNADGEWVFTLNHRGHVITATTFNSKRGNPLGTRFGMEITIDGVQIEYEVSCEFSAELRAYLATRFSDEAALESAKKLAAFAQTLD